MQPMLENRILIRATIKEHLIKEESSFPYSKYIEYRVQVETQYKKWSIDRRYKNFESLHNELKNKISSLPKFPEKRLFSMSESTISERKEMFTEYLNYVLHRTVFTQNTPFLEFLGIDKELVMLLLKYPTTIHRNTLNYNSQMGISSSRTRKSKSVQKEPKFMSFLNNSGNFKEEIAPQNHIDELIKNLEMDKENICLNVNSFWDRMKRKKRWVNLTRDDIIKLYYGSKSSFNQNGLLFHCGNISKNILGAEACLGLIAKLIDYETNPDCENCVIILRMSRIEHIEVMNLEKHLTSNKPLVILNALKVLKVLVNNEKSIKIDQVLKEKANIERFNDFVLQSE